MTTLNTSPGASVDFQPVVSGSTPIVFSLLGPAWLSINAATGRVTGTVPSTQPAGSVDFTIIAQNCFTDGQPGNEVRKVVTLNVVLSCAPVAIFDSGTGTCVPTDIVTPTLINTIVRGQVVTSFTFKVTGDDSAAMPKVVWTTMAEAVLAKVAGTTADYRLIVATGDLPDGTYDFPVYASNCSSATNNSARTFRIIVGTGVSGPPSTGGGGEGCTVAITAPGSHPVDRPLAYQLTIAGGSTCSAWQTWLLRADGTGGPAGDGAVAGQNDSTSATPGNYTKDVSNLPPGDYLLWGKCNDAGSCQNAWVMRGITLTAPGTEPSSGGGCVRPALVPATTTTYSSPADRVVFIPVQTTEASPAQGVNLVVTDAGGNGVMPYLRAIAGTARRFSVLVSVPPGAVPGTSRQFTVAPSNPCGAGLPETYTINYVATPTPPANCVPATASQPPDTTVTDLVATATTVFTVAGTDPIEVFSESAMNVSFSRSGNVVTATARVFGGADTQIPIMVGGLCGGTTMRIWTIKGNAPTTGL